VGISLLKVSMNEWHSEPTHNMCERTLGRQIIALWACGIWWNVFNK